MATLQDTFVPLGFSRDRAAELAKELTKLAVDVASFNNASDPETIQLFTSALVGNHEAVRRYGIMITETSLKQEMLRQGFKKNFSELTNLEKVQLRYNIILNSTKDAQGDAIRTAGEYANQVKRMNAEIRTAWESLGKLFLPVFTDIVSIIGKAADAIGNFVDSFRPKDVDDYIAKLKELGAELIFIAEIEARRAILAEKELRLEAGRRTREVLMSEEEAAVKVEFAKKRQLEIVKKILELQLTGQEDLVKIEEKRLEKYEQIGKEAKNFLADVKLIKESTERIASLEQTILDIKKGKLKITRDELKVEEGKVEAIEKQMRMSQWEREEAKIKVRMPLAIGIHEASIAMWEEYYDKLGKGTEVVKTQTSTLGDWINTSELLINTLSGGIIISEKFARNIGNLVYSFATGNVAGVIGGFIQAIAGLGTEIETTTISTEEMTRALKSHIDALRELTLAELHLELERLKGLKAFAERFPTSASFERLIRNYQDHIDAIQEAIDNFGTFADTFSDDMRRFTLVVNLLDVKDPIDKLRRLIKILGIDLPQSADEGLAAMKRFADSISEGKTIAEAWGMAFPNIQLPENLSPDQIRKLMEIYVNLLRGISEETVTAGEAINKRQEQLALTRTKQITYRQANELVTGIWSIDLRLEQIYNLLQGSIQARTAIPEAAVFETFAHVVNINAQMANVSIDRADIKVGADGLTGATSMAEAMSNVTIRQYRAGGLA